MLDEVCSKCATPEGTGPTVFKFKISFFSQGNSQIKELCKEHEYKFCLALKCDETLAKIRFLCKDIKIPPKKGTFADELTPEELQRKREYREKFLQKYGNGKKRDFKGSWRGKRSKNPEEDEMDGGPNEGEKSFAESKFKNYNLYQKAKQESKQAASAKAEKAEKAEAKPKIDKPKGTRESKPCALCGKVRHMANSTCPNKKPSTRSKLDDY